MYFLALTDRRRRYALYALQEAERAESAETLAGEIPQQRLAHQALVFEELEGDQPVYQLDGEQTDVVTRGIVGCNHTVTHQRPGSSSLSTARRRGGRSRRTRR